MKRKAHITISGHDHVGIIANISKEMAKYGVNIVDVSQTVLSEHFTMVLVADLSGLTISVDEFSQRMESLINQLNLSMRMKLQ